MPLSKEFEDPGGSHFYQLLLIAFAHDLLIEMIIKSSSSLYSFMRIAPYHGLPSRLQSEDTWVLIVDGFISSHPFLEVSSFASARSLQQWPAALGARS